MMTSKPCRELNRAEALGLLGSVPVGRIVYTVGALPAAHPLRHVVDGDHVYVLDAVETPAAAAIDTVVAYQADALGPGDRVEWTVLVTGVARKHASDRYAGVVIRIHPELVSGFAYH